MRRVALLALAIGFFVPFLASAPAHAQATRTWVSGVGDDANPCSRTAPCKTFAGAISKTAPAGEIDCLDPGGFGAVTITKSITLNCSATLGSILVSGTNAINIAAGTNDLVVLRNLQLQGIGSGLNGVRITGAKAVSIENCVITQFTQQGISDARTAGNTKLFVRGTIVSHNGSTGIAFGATAPNSAVIEDSHVVDNLFGIAAGTGTLAMVTRSVISGNTTEVDIVRYTMAHATFERGDTEAALLHIEVALAAAREAKYPLGVAEDLMLLAEIVHAHNEPERAEQSLLEAARMFEEQQRVPKWAAAHIRRAEILIEMGRRADALDAFRIVEETVMRDGSPASRERVRQGIARAREQPHAPRSSQ